MNEKLREDARAIGIPPADQLSDVLIHSEKSVNPIINMATGVEGAKIRDVMRKGKPAVMLSTSFCYQEAVLKNQVGVYAVHLKKHDALVMLFCSFNRVTPAWELQTRVIITKDNEQEVELFGENLYRTVLDTSCKIVDMTGQVCFSFGSWADAPRNANMFNEVSKALRSFVGGVVYSPSKNIYDNFEGPIGVKSFLKEFNRIYMQDKDRLLGIREIYMDDIQFEKKPLPESIKQKLRKVAVKMLEKNVNLNYCNDTLFISEKPNAERFSYLQRCNDGNYVLRVFSAYIKQIQTDPNGVTLKYTEIYRIGMTKDVLSDLNTASHPVLGYDEEGIDDGIFKYVKKLLDYCVANAESVCNNQFDFVNAKNDFKSVLIAVFCPFFEKLYNYTNSRGLFELQRRLVAIARASKNIENFKLSLSIGDIDETKKDLHQILGVPKRILENMELNDSGEWFTRIRNVKELFENDKEYLMSMNTADIDRLCLFMKQQKMMDGKPCVFHNLHNLITAYGGKNVCGYMNFLENMDDKEASRYKDYTEKIVVVKQFVSTMDWKLKGDALEKADEAITAAYNIMNDQTVYKDVLHKFQRWFDKWKKYEFSDGKFFITFPTGPSAIVEEGIKLHHCVKEFISTVANGETIILFIREVDRPMKPFFTLEVQDYEIRQVHGNSNCSINEVDGLREFLEKFCDEKVLSVDFEDANRLLGPE